LNELPKKLPGTVRATWEAFNLKDKQAGNTLLSLTGLVGSKEDTSDRQNMLNYLGAYRWANVVWNHLETATDAWLGPPLEEQCAVGFKMMGPEVDNFGLRQTEEVLRDPQIKKIMLVRGDTYAQWLSRQWACWSNDYGSHTKNLTDLKGQGNFDWKEWTEARIQAGELCKCGYASQLETYTTFKDDVFKTWREEMNGQEFLELYTENLSDEDLFERIQGFLFQSVEDASSVTLDEDGYEKVAQYKNNGQMSTFIERVIKQHKGHIKNRGGLVGLVPYYSGASNMQTFRDMLEDLSSAKWVTNFHGKVKRSAHRKPLGDSSEFMSLDEELEAMDSEDPDLYEGVDWRSSTQVAEDERRQKGHSPLLLTDSLADIGAADFLRWNTKDDDDDLVDRWSRWEKDLK